MYILNSVAGVGYAPSYQGKSLSGQIANPQTKLPAPMMSS
jgi:hypothetical protein